MTMSLASAAPPRALAAAVTRRRRSAACSSSSGGGRQQPPAAARPAPRGQVATVTITAAKGCELDTTDVRRRRHHVQDHEQGRDRGERGRTALRRAHPRREGERRRPGSAASSRSRSTPASTRCTARAPPPRSSTITVTGKAAAGRRQRRRAAQAAAPTTTRSYVDTQIGYLVDGDGEAQHRAARHRPQGRAGRVHRGPSVLREDRAGRRVVRQRQAEPRRRHRRPRRATSRRRSGAAST